MTINVGARTFKAEVVKLPSNVFDVPYYVLCGYKDDDELLKFSRGIDVFSEHIERRAAFTDSNELYDIVLSIFLMMSRDATLLMFNLIDVDRERREKYGHLNAWHDTQHKMTVINGFLSTVSKLAEADFGYMLTNAKNVVPSYNALVSVENNLSKIVLNSDPNTQYAEDSAEFEAALLLPLARDALAMMTTWNKALGLLIKAMEEFNKNQGEVVFN